MSEKSKTEKKNLDKDANAKKVAEIMCANMKANMANPDFLMEKERMMDEIAKKVMAKHNFLKEEKTK